MTFGKLRNLLLILVLVPLAAIPVRAQVSLDLRDADIRSFVEIVAEATGRSFVLDPQVRGTVTVLSPGSLSADAVYEVFLNVLEINRLTVVEGNEVDRVVPMSSARELASGSEQVGGGFETRVIEVQNAPLSEIAEVVRPLLPAEAVMTAIPSAKLLIISDRAENHQRIASLIARLDEPRQQTIEMIRLRNANAAEVLQVVEALGIIPESANVSVDRRSNALVVSGPDELREQVRTLAARLDTQQNNVSSEVVRLNYADASALGDVILRSLSATQGDQQGQISIVPEPQTNSLLISAPQDRMGDIAAMIRALDTRPDQVLVEAVIFEMSVQGFSDLTGQFGAILNDAVVGGVQFSLEGRPTLTGLVSSVLNGGQVDPGAGGTLGGQFDNGSYSFAGFMSAIARTNSTRLLSTPSIMTLNNQEAEIVVAQNVPFVTGSYSTVGDSAVPDAPFQTVERQDVGLTLKVTPQINADSTVRLSINQEVSNLTNSSSAAGGEITARRALSTTVLVSDGNVIMLGGLLEDGSGAVSQRVPGLSRMPLLGGLFRGQNSSRDQRVLLIMLRPRVIDSEAEAARITRQVAREARAAAEAITPEHAPVGGGLPFDGADLNQPFDAGFVDDVAQRRNFPPLPSRLRFDSQ